LALVELKERKIIMKTIKFNSPVGEDPPKIPPYKERIRI
jgi:hypothetical protein